MWYGHAVLPDAEVAPWCPRRPINYPTVVAGVTPLPCLHQVGCTKGASYACFSSKLILVIISTMPISARVVLAHLSMFILCYLMARAQLPPMARKLGLSLFPLLLVNPLQGSGLSANHGGITPLSDGGGTFALHLLATSLLGCSCAVAAGLLPWPALAVVRVGPKRTKTAQLVAELLHSFGVAFSREIGPGSSSRVRRKLIVRRLRVESASMRELTSQAAWNPLLGLFTPVLLPYMLPTVRSNGRGLAADKSMALWEGELELTRSRLALIDDCRQSIAIMEEALRHSIDADKIAINRFRTLINGPLLAMIQCASDVLESDTGEHVTFLELVQKRDLWRQSWKRFNTAYYAARKQVYYSSSGERPSPLTANSLLSLNAYIFNLRHIGKSLLDDLKVRQQRKDDAGPKAADLCCSCKTASGTLAGRFYYVFFDVASKGATPREAAKIALAMGLGGAIDHMLLHQEAAHNNGSPLQPALVAFTVAYLCLGDGTVGTSFDTSKQRGEGTLVGSSFAALVFGLGLTSLSESAGAVLTTVLLVTFVTASGYVRGSTSYSYAGTVAAFTAPVLMLSPPNVDSGEDATSLAYSRIEQTILGIAVWLVVEFGLWPKLASESALDATMASLKSASSVMAALCHVDMAALDGAYEALSRAEGPPEREYGEVSVTEAVNDTISSPHGETGAVNADRAHCTIAADAARAACFPLHSAIAEAAAKVASARKLAAAASREPEFSQAPFPTA